MQTAQLLTAALHSALAAWGWERSAAGDMLFWVRSGEATDSTASVQQLLQTCPGCLLQWGCSAESGLLLLRTAQCLATAAYIACCREHARLRLACCCCRRPVPPSREQPVERGLGGAGWPPRAGGPRARKRCAGGAGADRGGGAQLGAAREARRRWGTFCRSAPGSERCCAPAYNYQACCTVRGCGPAGTRLPPAHGSKLPLISWPRVDALTLCCSLQQAASWSVLPKSGTFWLCLLRLQCLSGLPTCITSAYGFLTVLSLHGLSKSVLTRHA